MRIGLIKVKFQERSKKIKFFKCLKIVTPDSENHWAIQNYKNVAGYRNLQFAIIDDTPDKKYGFTNDHTNNITMLEPYQHGDEYYYFEKVDYPTHFTGLSDAGSVQIYDYTHTPFEYAGTVSFYPAVFNHAQYNELLTDLYGISQNLIINAERQVKATTIENNRSTTLLENIENLKHSLRLINDYPFTHLTPSLTLKSEQRQQKFDLRFELNRLKNPGRKNHFGSDMTENKATVENQLIKQMLEDLLMYSQVQVDKLEQSSAAEDLEYLDQNQASNSSHPDQIGQELKVNLKEVEGIRAHLLAKPYQPADEPYEKARVINIQTDDLVQYIDVKKNCLVSTNFSLTVWSDTHQKPLKTVHLVNDETASHFQIEQLRKDQLIDIKVEKNGTFINIKSLDLGWTPFDGRQQWLEKLSPIYSNHAQDEQKYKAFYEQKQKVLLQKKSGQEMEISAKYQAMIQLIEKCLQLDLFKNIEKKHRLPLTPTATFLNHPIYNMAWRALTNIDKEVGLNFIYTLPHENESFEIDYVRETYERWLYFKMIDLLVNEIGWSLEEDVEILKNKVHQLFAVQKSGDAVNMEVKLHFHNKIKLSVYYEPKIMMKSSSHHYKPDYVLVFEDNLGQRKAAIMDAKLREYDNQRFNNNPHPELRDIAQVSLFKYDYAMLKNISGSWAFLADPDTLVASGIFHPDLVLDTLFPFNVYNKFYNQEQWNTTRAELKKEIQIKNGSHFEEIEAEVFDKIKPNRQRYSSIPFAPGHTKDFKNWFRMIMEYHLLEYEICWNCGRFNTEDDLVIEKESHFTTAPYKKHYYHCQNCHEFWIKTHCSNTGSNHHLIKHYYNYLKETNADQWYVQCPICVGVKTGKDEE